MNTFLYGSNKRTAHSKSNEYLIVQTTKFQKQSLVLSYAIQARPRSMRKSSFYLGIIISNSKEPGMETSHGTSKAKQNYYMLLLNSIAENSSRNYPAQNEATFQDYINQ